jgi:PAS domain S-box-containing protein
MLKPQPNQPADEGECPGRHSEEQVQAKQPARKPAEELAASFLSLINQSTGTKDLIERATAFFREQSGCEAVGIRLKEGDDYPYYETRGFPQEFVRAENSLCTREPGGQIQRDSVGNPVLACMCGNIICGRFDPSKPFFSPAGSFWTNNTTQLLGVTTEADRQARTRNHCNGQGYESVALIALRSGQQTLGLLQLNDKQPGRFTPELIALWERLAGYLAVAIAKARSEEALRESEERFRIIVEGAQDYALFMLDPGGNVVSWNAGAERIKGYGAEEIMGRNISIFYPSEDIAHGKPGQQLERASREGRLADEGWRVRKDGSRFWANVVITALRDGAGNLKGFSKITRDRTERQRVEETLRFLGECGWAPSAEDFFQALARHLAQSLGADFVCIDRLQEGSLAAETVAVFFDGKFQDNVTYTLKDTPCGDVVGKTICCFPRDVRGLFPKDLVLQEMLAEGYVGTTLWSSRGQPIGLIALIWRQPLADTRLASSIVQLVAVRAAGELERRQAEEAVRESETKLALALRSAGMGVWRFDLREQKRYFDEQVCRCLGIGPARFGGTAEEFYAAVHPDDRDRLQAALQSAVTTGAPYEVEYRVFWPDGSVHHVAARGQLARDAAGEPQWIDGVIWDVTERQQIEAALRQSEARAKVAEAVRVERQRLVEVLDKLPAYVILLTPDYRVPLANRFFEQRFGKSEGRRCYDYLFHRTEPCENCQTYNVLKTNSPQRWEWTGPDSRNYDIYDFPFTDVDGSPLIMEVGLDITERKQAEVELKKHREHLQDIVHERTAALRATNDELNRFNRVMLGREMRVIELKQEVNALRSRLGQPPRYGVQDGNAPNDR